MDIKDRIRQVMDSLNLSQQEFANSLGLAPSSLSTIFNGRTNPTFKHISAIHQAFPAINLYWLQFGEGEMYGGKDEILPSPNSPSDDDKDVSNQLINVQNDKPADTTIFDRSVDLFDQESKPRTNDTTSFKGRVDPRAVEILQRDKQDVEENIPERKITEIRVFFDDGTYQILFPEKK